MSKPKQNKPKLQGITLEEWRKNDALVTGATNALSHPYWPSMLELLRVESPHNYHLINPTLEERAVHQAKIEGYNTCLNNLLAMGSGSVEDAKTLAATFEQP
jgi:hypothetical protein